MPDGPVKRLFQYFQFGGRENPRQMDHPIGFELSTNGVIHV